MTGRLQPCPCGSAKRFRNCCGRLASGDALGSIGAVRQAASEKQRTEQQGFGRPIVSEILSGKRHITVGNGSPQAVDSAHFHGFLVTYIENCLGKEWMCSEPSHPLVELKSFFETGRAKLGPNYFGPVNAGMEAYFRLAYDLYSLDHNAYLQEKLLNRLRNKEQYESAKHEIFVAASMIRAGFEIEFEDEDDRNSTHCEFAATYKRTGKRFSVEAKCLRPRRAGDLRRNRLIRNLNGALAKQALYERIVFIELNTEEHQSGEGVMEIVSDAAKKIENRAEQVAGIASPPAFVVLTNSPFLVTPESLDVRQTGGIIPFNIDSFADELAYRSAQDLRLARQLFSEIFTLQKSIRNHSMPPVSFGGDIPIYELGIAKRKPRIGDRLAVDIGTGEQRIGTVVHCSIMEARSAMVAMIQCENVEMPIVREFDLSPDEMAAWRAHPDTFFGVIRHPGTVNNSVELYDWLLSNYAAMPRDNMIFELSAHYPDDMLRALSTDELAEHLAALMADTMHPPPWTHKKVV